MSEYSPGTFQFAERIMDMNVQQAHRAARAEGLCRQARAGALSNRPVYCTALAWLGQRLAGWGKSLHERYGSEGPTSMPQSAERLVS
jgi:hypothetical protein